MKKDDIRKYNLFYSACHPYDIIENCIRFLVEWDPEYLFQIDRQGIAPLPFQVVAECSSNRYFRLLFEYFIRYYPYKKGISNLFRTNEFGVLVKSPFNVACGGSSDPTQRKRIMDIIEEALAWYHATTPINTVEALFLSATNPLIDLDGVYFLLRRQPEVLLKMMSHSEIVTTTTTLEQDRKRKRSECYRGCIVIFVLFVSVCLSFSLSHRVVILRFLYHNFYKTIHIRCYNGIIVWNIGRYHPVLSNAFACVRIKFYSHNANSTATLLQVWSVSDTDRKCTDGTVTFVERDYENIIIIQSWGFQNIIIIWLWTRHWWWIEK